MNFREFSLTKENISASSDTFIHSYADVSVVCVLFTSYTCYLRSARAMKIVHVSCKHSARVMVVRLFTFMAYKQPYGVQIPVRRANSCTMYKQVYGVQQDVRNAMSCTANLQVYDVQKALRAISCTVHKQLYGVQIAVRRVNSCTAYK